MFDPVVGSSEPATQTYRKHILIGVLVLGLVCAVLGVWFGLQDHDHDQTSSTSSAPTQSVSRTYPVAPTPQQIHFALDPGNSLPRYDIAALDSIFDSRKGPGKLVGANIRLRGRISLVGRFSFSFQYPTKPFLYDTYVMEGLEDEVLDALKQGQEVEVLCHYTGVWEKDDDEHGRYSGFLYRFVGLEVHPIQ